MLLLKLYNHKYAPMCVFVPPVYLPFVYISLHVFVRCVYGSTMSTCIYSLHFMYALMCLILHVYVLPCVCLAVRVPPSISLRRTAFLYPAICSIECLSPRRVSLRVYVPLCACPLCACPSWCMSHLVSIPTICMSGPLPMFIPTVCISDRLHVYIPPYVCSHRMHVSIVCMSPSYACPHRMYAPLMCMPLIVYVSCCVYPHAVYVQPPLYLYFSLCMSPPCVRPSERMSLPYMYVPACVCPDLCVSRRQRPTMFISLREYVPPCFWFVVCMFLRRYVFSIHAWILY